MLRTIHTLLLKSSITLWYTIIETFKSAKPESHIHIHNNQSPPPKFPNGKQPSGAPHFENRSTGAQDGERAATPLESSSGDDASPPLGAPGASAPDRPTAAAPPRYAPAPPRRADAPALRPRDRKTRQFRNRACRRPLSEAAPLVATRLFLCSQSDVLFGSQRFFC